jgi:hypothetical protein
LGLASTSQALLIEVTACGQIVPDRATGYLSADLDCSGFGGGATNLLDRGAAVNLGRKSTLDLRGFTLTGGVYGVLGDNVRCGRDRHDCSPGPHEVFGGTVRGGSPGADRFGIGGRRLVVHDVTVTGFEVGVWGYSRLALANAHISGASYGGVNSA